MEISAEKTSDVFREIYNSGRKVIVNEAIMKEHGYVYNKSDDAWHNEKMLARVSGIYVRNLSKEALENMLKRLGEVKITTNSTIDMKV